MNTRHENADGPEDIDKAFAEIVAELERDSSLPQWPGESGTASPTTSGGTATTGDPSTEPPSEADADSGPRDWAPTEAEEDEGHYEPPEPPPLPKPGASTVGGVVLIVLGLLTLFVPFAASSLGPLTLPVGLIAISCGIGWLLLRLRQGSPDDEDSGWDDGAQV